MNISFTKDHRDNISKADKVSVVFLNSESKVFEIVVNRDKFTGNDDRAKQMFDNFFELNNIEDVTVVQIVIHNSAEKAAQTVMNFDINQMSQLDRTILLNNIVKGRGLEKISRSA